MVSDSATDYHDEEKTTISLKKGARNEAREIKPDGVNWSWFIRQAARAWKEKNEHE